MDRREFLRLSGLGMGMMAVPVMGRPTALFGAPTPIPSGDKKALHSPIHDANISVTSLHLANIAWKLRRSLATSPKTGRVLKDKAAMAMWGRKYQKGWEPKV